VVKIIEGEYSNNYEIAHIRGAKETGPRHDDRMTDAERKAFSNLVLLCHGHHVRVDGPKHRDEYTPEILLEWKSAREAEGQDALAGLTRLTEDTLETILTDAFAAKQEQIMETLARLEVNDSEAADLLRDLMAELNQLRQYGAFLDVDAAAKLYRASTMLADLDIGRSARTLSSMGSVLEGLPRTVESLRKVVLKLEGMEGRW
jgi:hypothetical protein